MSRALLNRTFTLAGALLAAVVSAGGCGKAVDQTDSESHFLAFCTGECAEGLSCVCGVCTKPCDEDIACQDLALGSRCAFLSGGSCDIAAALVCDVECTSDADCSALGATHECLPSGRCRQRGGDGTIDGGDPPSSEPPLGELGEPGEIAALDERCCPDVLISPGPYSLERCRFSQRSGFDLTCESELPGCDASATVRGVEIQSALRHPDMVALLDEPRSASGPVFGWKGGNTQASSRRILVSHGSDGSLAASVWQYDCSESLGGQTAPSSCRPIPPGLRAFMELQDTLVAQQLALADCAPSLDTDPCAVGAALGDESCAGAITRPLDTPLSPLCFASEAQACLCACAETNTSLASCVIQQGALLEASCGP